MRLTATQIRAAAKVSLHTAKFLPDICACFRSSAAAAAQYMHGW